MHKPRVDRRQFVKTLAGSAAAASAMPARGFATPLVAQAPPRIRFSVIGINHGHINSQVQAVQRGGGELVSMFAREADLTAAFAFTDPANLEVLVKTLDFGDRVLVLYGTLSNLEYTLRITEISTGTVKTYRNAAGNYCGGLDNNAF